MEAQKDSEHFACLREFFHLCLSQSYTFVVTQEF